MLWEQWTWTRTHRSEHTKCYNTHVHWEVIHRVWKFKRAWRLNGLWLESSQEGRSPSIYFVMYRAVVMGIFHTFTSTILKVWDADWYFGLLDWRIAGIILHMTGEADDGLLGLKLSLAWQVQAEWNEYNDAAVAYETFFFLGLRVHFVFCQIFAVCNIPVNDSKHENNIQGWNRVL